MIYPYFYLMAFFGLVSLVIDSFEVRKSKKDSDEAKLSLYRHYIKFDIAQLVLFTCGGLAISFAEYLEKTGV